jgi:small-conductance mechanosensitive channel
MSHLVRLATDNGLPDAILHQLGIGSSNGFYPVLTLAVSAIVYLPILVVTHLLGRIVRWAARRSTLRARWDPQLTLLVSRVAYIGVLVAGAVAYINAISGSVAQVLVGTIGLLSLAFGLAFQDVLKNFLSGIFLLLERPFRLGDEITVNSHSGKVETIALRVTVLRSAGGERILLPNQEVYTSAIVNSTGYPLRQFTSAVRVPDGAPLAELVRQAADAIAGVPGVAATPAPAVLFVPRVDTGPSLEVRYWVNQHEASVAEVQAAVNLTLLDLVGGRSATAT